MSLVKDLDNESPVRPVCIFVKIKLITVLNICSNDLSVELTRLCDLFGKIRKNFIMNHVAVIFFFRIVEVCIFLKFNCDLNICQLL